MPRLSHNQHISQFSFNRLSSSLYIITGNRKRSIREDADVATLPRVTIGKTTITTTATTAPRAAVQQLKWNAYPVKEKKYIKELKITIKIP